MEHCRLQRPKTASPGRVGQYPCKNRKFFSHAAAAERAGYRPCLRCRPELAPGLARVDAVPRIAESAARQIAAGALNGHDVEGLASSLGVSGRQLRRAMQEEVGVSPIELAQIHRLLLAKQLLTETSLPITRARTSPVRKISPSWPACPVQHVSTGSGPWYS